jgi:hypothetical protein
MLTDTDLTIERNHFTDFAHLVWSMAIDTVLAATENLCAATI